MISYARKEVCAIDEPAAIAEDISGLRGMILCLIRGEVSEDEFRKYRLQRGVYAQRSEGKASHVIRVKVPCGILTSKQLTSLGEIAQLFSGGVAHITTRQDIQFYSIRIENVANVLSDLQEAGFTTREACGNSVRNIVCSPLAGVSQSELFDVTPYARLLAARLLRNGVSQTLPRKFKISFSGSEKESDGITPWIHDIGFVAALRQNNGTIEKGFKVFVGGGLGSKPRIADVFDNFLPEKLLVPTTEAILSVFNALGNRENRKKARLKYVLWKIGIDEFQRAVNEERSGILNSMSAIQPMDDKPETEYPPLENDSIQIYSEDDEFRKWIDSNVIPQKQTGYNVVRIKPPLGNVTTEQFFLLNNLAQRFSDGTVRTTTEQSVVLRWIRYSDLEAVYKKIQNAGFAISGRRSIVSCPGVTTCQVGITHSQSLAKELMQLIENHPEWNEILKELNIKISGCTNSCGQHPVASIGFHGAVRYFKGKQIPCYVMSVGGGLKAGKEVLGMSIGKIPARSASEALTRVLNGFLLQKIKDENFHTYIERVGIQALKNDIKDFTETLPETRDSNLFTDIGETIAFATKTTEGECAV